MKLTSKMKRVQHLAELLEQEGKEVTESTLASKAINKYNGLAPKDFRVYMTEFYAKRNNN